MEHTPQESLRASLEKLIWRHYNRDNLSVEELLDEAMPLIESEVQREKLEETMAILEILNEEIMGSENLIEVAILEKVQKILFNKTI